MRRLVPFLVFFVVVCNLLAAIHYYLWLRLVRDLGLPPTLHTLLTGFFVVLFLSVPAALLLGRALPKRLTRVGLLPVYVWMGSMWVLLVVVAGVDVAKLAVSGALALWGADLSRAGVLAQGAPLVTLGLGLGATLFALTGGASLRVKRVEVPLAKLPRELDGTKVVQISDVHVGPTIGRAFIERVVETINRLEPDVVVVTGDLVDGTVAQLRDAVAPLARLQARQGCYFVTGNHEYYSGAVAWCRHLEELGLRVLRNQRVAIQKGGAAFDLAGIDDHSAHGFGNGHGADLAGALQGRDPTRALVLLAHQPRAVFEARRHGVDLQLSGHTHGGQIWPFHYLVRLQQPVVSGLVRLGETLLYVSNGTGYWGPPMRLRAPAEVTELVLRAGAA